MEEVIGAIQSLYVDGLRPFGRILRKRTAERLLAAGRGAQDIDMACLRAACAACPWLRVEDTEGGDWVATFAGYPEPFVDIYSPEDPYPAELWEGAAAYFESLDDDHMVLPGGRYSCAQELMSRRLGFLSGYSLGQVSHVVQLAISQKRLLGYLNGAVVPYGRSGSKAKDQCAASQKPFAGAAPCAAGEARLVEWEELRRCMQELMLRVPAGGSMPLSNVKRLFRSRFHVELSETALGHSKLSELLNDRRLQDICFVRLQGHGYVVVHPRQRGRCISLSSGIIAEDAAPAPAEPEEGPGRGPPAASAGPAVARIRIRNTFVHVDDEPSADTPANKGAAWPPRRAQTAPAPEALDAGSSDDEEDSAAWAPSKPAGGSDEGSVGDLSEAAGGAGDGPDCSDSCSTGTGGEAGPCAAGAELDPPEAQAQTPLEPMYLVAALPDGQRPEGTASPGRAFGPRAPPEHAQAVGAEASSPRGVEARRLGLLPRTFVVQNTFVHVAPEPETPWVSAVRRASTTTNARSAAAEDMGFGIM